MDDAETEQHRTSDPALPECITRLAGLPDDATVTAGDFKTALLLVMAKQRSLTAALEKVLVIIGAQGAMLDAHALMIGATAGAIGELAGDRDLLGTVAGAHAAAIQEHVRAIDAQRATLADLARRLGHPGADTLELDLGPFNIG